jgi:hypothetical protein
MRFEVFTAVTMKNVVFWEYRETFQTGRLANRPEIRTRSTSEDDYIGQQLRDYDNDRKGPDLIPDEVPLYS